MMIWMLTLLSCFAIITVRGSTKLLLIQMIFRHGDRSPYTLYPTDPNPVDVWSEGLGKLTKIGKKQHYDLGKYLRSMYSHFITTNPNEVMVNSSSSDRCLRSAAANLASFYAPRPEYAFDEDWPWQPIPIHYLPPAQDKYLFVERAKTCRSIRDDLKDIYNSQDYRDLYERHQVMLEHLSVYSGYNLTRNILNSVLLFDTLFVEKTHKLTIPEWVKPYWEELSDYSDYSFHFFFKYPTSKRLLVGPLIGDIVEKFQRKASGEETDIKVRIFSAHDVNIAAIMSSFEVFNMRRPPYCATIIFELHEMEDGQKAVRMLHLNTTSPQHGVYVPYVLKLKGCGEFCPLDVFVQRAMQGVPQNWEDECWGDKQSASGGDGKIPNLLVLSVFLVWFFYYGKIRI